MQEEDDPRPDTEAGQEVQEDAPGPEDHPGDTLGRDDADDDSDE